MNLSNNTFINLIYIPTQQKEPKILFSNTLEELKRCLHTEAGTETWNGFELGEEFQLGSYEIKVVAIVPTDIATVAEYQSSFISSHISYYVMPLLIVQ